ncbi:MAG: sel1 repeat family protein [Rhodospirillales bacterium]|nr:sel1 repeat family protein [Rhodospirillales bacterium]
MDLIVSLVGLFWSFANSIWTFAVEYEEILTIVGGIILAYLCYSDKTSPLRIHYAAGILVGVLIVGPLWRRFVDLPWYADLAIILVVLIVGFIATARFAEKWFAEPHEISKDFLIWKPEFSDAMDALDAGDYEKVFSEFRKLADEGNPVALNNLGMLFEIGLGGHRSDSLAERCYRQAAKLGVADAQFNLAAILAADLMKDDTTITPSDDEKSQRFIEAYMWAYLAALKKNPAAEKAVGRLKKHMSKEQIRTAERMAALNLNTEWKHEV